MKSSKELTDLIIKILRKMNLINLKKKEEVKIMNPPNQVIMPKIVLSIIKIAILFKIKK